MNNTRVYQRGRALISALAALALFGSAAVYADTNVKNAWGTNTHIGNSNCNSPFDTLRLNATRTLAEGTPPWNGNAIQALSDVTFWYPYENCWESTTWTSNGTGRKPARISGVSENPYATSVADFYLPTARFIKLRNLTIDNVDLDMENTALWFYTSGLVAPVPGISLTLNNASLTSLDAPAAFDSRASFALTATGDSTISNWPTRVPVRSPTTLNVTGATSKLTLFRVGKTTGNFFEAFYFSGAGSSALIDAGTLKLNESAMTFGAPAGSPAQMTFQNGATLELTGPDAKLQTNNASFTNSNLKLGLGVTTLKIGDQFTINGLTADVGDSATVVSPTLNVSGNNTLNLGEELYNTGYSMTASVMVMEPGSSLTLNGRGSLMSDSQLRWSLAPGGNFGHIVINDSARLVSNGGNFRIIPGAPVTINRSGPGTAGMLSIKNSGALELLGSSGFANFSNRGIVNVESNGFMTVPADTFTILGGNQGTINIGTDGWLRLGNYGTAIGATAVLSTDNQVLLDNFSTLQLTLDPTARKNSQLRISAELMISNFADLNLGLANDQVLPVGTKFVLINYASLIGLAVNSRVVTYFNGYPNGSSFVLGLNRYQINYKDSGDPGFAGAVTLTVVPLVPPVAALSPTPQTVSGTVAASITPSASLVASNFGGTVTYSINPALPPGLKLDPVKGVISGVSSQTIASTSFTIRGVGSTSGDANAIVNLTIAKANQTISFGPAPTATYAPGGVVQVSASASSSLPVTYSSLTPLVCTASSGSVYILSAGTCTIAADQVGDAHYNPATTVTQTLTIVKAPPAPLVLLTAPANINVSQTSALSTSGGSGTGAISYAVTGACSIVGTTLTGNALGTCTVTATQAADANYNAITSNPVNIRVGAGAQATLILLASPTSLNVNGTSALSTTGGSGTGAVIYAVASGPCTVSASTLSATASGQCQVIATKAADSNFGEATSNPVTLTINLLTPSPLVLSASPATVGFGGSSALSTSGGISGGAVTYSVTGPCYVTGNTLTGTSVGTCQVSASQAATPVYNAATSNAVAVIVKERTTTFSYPSGTATLGQPFNLTPIATGFTTPVFALLYGNLPAGLSLNPSTGMISGTPTGPLGAFDFVVSVFENNAYDAALAVVVVRAGPESIPTLSEWGVILLSALMALVALVRLRNPQRDARQ